jgi:hypothetical protein
LGAVEDVVSGVAAQTERKLLALAGLTHVDFLALPAKARVSMIYEGDEHAEGFMGIKKL